MEGICSSRSIVIFTQPQLVVVGLPPQDRPCAVQLLQQYHVRHLAGRGQAEDPQREIGGSRWASLNKHGACCTVHGACE